MGAEALTRALEVRGRVGLVPRARASWVPRPWLSGAEREHSRQRAAPRRAGLVRERSLAARAPSGPAREARTGRGAHPPFKHRPPPRPRSPPHQRRSERPGEAARRSGSDEAASPAPRVPAQAPTLASAPAPAFYSYRASASASASVSASASSLPAVTRRSASPVGQPAGAARPSLIEVARKPPDQPGAGAPAPSPLASLGIRAGPPSPSLREPTPRDPTEAPVARRLLLPRGDGKPSRPSPRPRWPAQAPGADEARRHRPPLRTTGAPR